MFGKLRKHQIATLNKNIAVQMTKNSEDENAVIDAAEVIMCRIVHVTAKNIIGQETMTDINKLCVTKEVTTIINNLRNEKKGKLSKMLQCIKNLKISTNCTITP